jgi:hypothetical protein
MDKGQQDKQRQTMQWLRTIGQTMKDNTMAKGQQDKQ